MEIIEKFEMPNSDIDIINNYKYELDFRKYMEILQTIQ